MQFDGKSNFAIANIIVPPSPPSAGLTLTVQAGQGSLFTGPPPYNLTAWEPLPPLGNPTASKAEIVRVEKREGDVFTFSERAQENTVAKAIGAGWVIADTITVKALRDIEEALENEATTRQSADNSNASAINSEKTRAEGVEELKATIVSLNAEASARETADGLRLLKSENLKDLGSASTARTNLGLGSAAVEPSSAFDPKGAAASAEAAASTALSGEKTRAETQEGLKLAKAENLKDVSSAATARTNLGLGTAATEPSTAFDAKGAAASAQTAAEGVTATEKTRAETAEALKLAKASNLSDLGSAITARTNLGLGTAAVEAASAFDAKGAAATAEAKSIPLTQKGAASGVAELTASSKLPIAELPAPNAGGHYETSFGNGSASSFVIKHELKTLTPDISVVNQSTGQEEGCRKKVLNENEIELSATAWETTPPGSAAYRVSVDASSGLVATNGSVLTSYALKSEVGANNGIAPLESAGRLPEVRLPISVISAVPSGVASMDTANIQSVLNALSEIAGTSNIATALFSSARPFQINAPLYKPWNVNIEGNAVFKAVEGFPVASVLLQDSLPTTIAAESNGGNVTSIASWSSPSAGVLKVASTIGYPSKGQIRVVNGSGTAIINYTGTTGTSFTGCTLAGGTGGVVSTGGSVSARTYEGVIGSGITLDSDNIAQTGLYLHYFAGMTVGCTVRNSLQDDVILGDSSAVASSYGASLLQQFFVDRTAGSMPSGHRCLWVTSACSDGTMSKSVLKGQKTGIQCDGSNWTFDTPHAWSEGMETCFYDNGLNNHFITPIADTPTTYGLLLGTSQNYGTYTGLFVEVNSIYGVDNTVVAVHNNGSGQENTFTGPVIKGANAEHRVAHDYTGDRTATNWIGAAWQNVVAISLGINFFSGTSGSGGIPVVIQIDSSGNNQAFQVYNTGQSSKLFAVDAAGRVARSNAQATLNGTTAGTAVSSQPEVGSSYKKFIVYLNGYENTGGVAQTIAFPVAFTHAPYIAQQPSAFGATVSTTTLTLPTGMGASVTGWVVVEGF